jgi:putative transposase
MENFKEIVNGCIRIGLEANVSSMKRLCSLSYGQLRERYQDNRLLSYYYLATISKAAGILASRKKSIKRGIASKDPYLKKPLLVSCYRFKITKNGTLRFSPGSCKTVNIPLNKHTLDLISASKGIEVGSFTITSYSLSLSVRKEVTKYTPSSFYGIDRNASNVTYGNSMGSIQFSLEKVEKIGNITRRIVRSFKRNDLRIRRKLFAKYGKRRSDRVKQIVHHVSKTVVLDAKECTAAIVFEDIGGLRNLYRKGNFQGKNLSPDEFCSVVRSQKTSRIQGCVGGSSRDTINKR